MMHRLANLKHLYVVVSTVNYVITKQIIKVFSSVYLITDPIRLFSGRPNWGANLANFSRVNSYGTTQGTEKTPAALGNKLIILFISYVTNKLFPRLHVYKHLLAHCAGLQAMLHHQELPQQYQISVYPGKLFFFQDGQFLEQQIRVSLFLSHI